MAQHDFLMELGTEELPPKALNTLAQALQQQMQDMLKAATLAHGKMQVFATPRRLALYIANLASHQPEQHIEKKGPALATGFDEQGKPTPALLGFAKSCNVDIKDLVQQDNRFVYRSVQAGKSVTELLPEMLKTAIKNLPIPKTMRWGAHEAEFVRPVHWLITLYGNEVMPANILGLSSGRISYGHRFMAPQAIEIRSPQDYEAQLAAHYVVASFDKRREVIKQQVQALAQQLQATAIIDAPLLEEVTNIVEWPVALVCAFEPSFLSVPQEALISAMQGHQKCFALTDAQGKLLPYFITVSNIISTQPQSVITGNQKVMRARLSDAAFFYHTDLKTPLSAHLAALAKVTFQAKLGSLADKTARVKQLAAYIAQQLKADVHLAERAAELSKADLMTHMVGEFPELQGIMGEYYAKAAQEPREVAEALNEQYLPRFAGDALPHSSIGMILSLADKLDTLVGIFGIGQKPSGSKDPFALRRATIGTLRILVERKLDLDLKAVLTYAASLYGNKIADHTADEVLVFAFERLRAWYQEQLISGDLFEAVYAVQKTHPLDFNKRIEAVNAFKALAEAKNLIAANKRVQNILSKNASPDLAWPQDVAAFSVPEERSLYTELERHSTLLAELSHDHYVETLRHLAGLRQVIDAFFDKVMVMSEDPAERTRRLALLQKLKTMFLRVADISKLQE